MTVEQSLVLADQHHRAGRPAEAERICRDVLSTQPGHPDALHLLGVVAAQTGRLDEGIELILRAVEGRPSFAPAWANLGCALVNAGQLVEAQAAYERLARLQPNDAAPHYALGLILKDLGRVEEAADAFARAVRLNPRFPEAHLKLGMCLRALGRTEEAIDAYSEALRRRPNFAEACNNLGNALRDRRRLDDAIHAYTQAARLRPDDPVAHLNLGNALTEKGRHGEAVGAYERATRLDPSCFQAHLQAAVVLANLGRFDEALRSQGRGEALRPDHHEAHAARGAILLHMHDMPAAAECFRRALGQSPGSSACWNGLGLALRSTGDFAEASDCFRRAIEIEPDNASFRQNLASLGGRDASPSELDRLRSMLDRTDLPADDRVAAGFALGKHLDDAGRSDEAFAAYAGANALFNAAPAPAGQRYDVEAVRRAVDRAATSFTPAFFADRRGWGVRSELPVFVVGMPRSGTSLVEQIAASHPAVFGAGELPHVGRLASTFRTPACHEWGPREIGAAAGEHLRALGALGGRARRVIDKMPGNLFELGLISVLFPDARVVFCRRDPRDTCLSCYFQPFARKDLHLYACDLEDCGRHFVETERLTRHWLGALPLRTLELRYEDLVADQEGQTRRLVDFLGLPWDPACLEFFRADRTVTTASVWQVRQPIYRRSVGRWRHYEHHIGPLLDALAVGTGDTPG
jgi:tetratricopeptide (TPR) repeat protein